MRAAQFAPAGAVLLALGVIAGATQLAGSSSPPAAPATAVTQQVAVTSAARACPPVQGNGAGTVAFIAGPVTASSTGSVSTGSVSTGSVSAGSVSAASGQAELAALPLADTVLRAAAPISQTEPSVLKMLTIPAAQSVTKNAGTVLQGWSVTATGAMAQAMEAEEATSSGVASVRCAEPGSDLWFVGPGQQSGAAQIQLDLMNVDTLTATVDVTAVTDAGPAQAGADTGITVPPHQTVTESLSSLAAGSSVVAIQVRTSVGRVAADVSENTSGGRTASWLPATAPPSTQLVIPGVATSSSAARLYIVVPGNSTAQVSVVALTSQGKYRPFGTQLTELPGDSATYVPLTPLGGTDSALELTANVPIAAAVLVPGSGLGAFTAATAPITEQAVVAGSSDGAGLSTTMALSAPAGAARVRLTELTVAGGAGATGKASSQQVTVAAGRTLAVPVSAPPGASRGSAFAVEITPLAGSGPLYAARVEAQGSSIVSIIPAVSALTSISLPPVRNSYDAISP
jgi:Family of unknown function (DUF5719)